MPVPFHEFNAAYQDRLLGHAWRRITYPVHALVLPVAGLIRQNGEVPVSWADLSTFSGHERLQDDAWTKAGHWTPFEDFSALSEAHGVPVGPLSIRPPYKTRGFPIVVGGETFAMVWDDARIQLHQPLAGLALEEDADDGFSPTLTKVLATAVAFLVDLYVLTPIKRRTIHAAWEPHAPLVAFEYGVAGSFGYWRRCAAMWAAAFRSVHTTLGPSTALPANAAALLGHVETLSVPPTLIDPRDWSLHWPQVP